MKEIENLKVCSWGYIFKGVKFRRAADFPIKQWKPNTVECHLESREGNNHQPKILYLERTFSTKELSEINEMD